MPGEDFDVLAYARTAMGRAELRREASAPLPPQLRDALALLARCADGATAWLSLVLVTPTHKDARVTAFLSAWAYEQHWVAEALHALAGPDDGTAASARARRSPLAEAVTANLHGTALTAVHMAERFVDALLVERMLERAAGLAPDQALRADLDAVRAVVARQRPFFREAAVARLGPSARARRLTRRRLRRRAWPLGADGQRATDPRAVLTALFGSDHTWADALDAEVDALPGLAGLRLLAHAAGNPRR